MPICDREARRHAVSCNRGCEPAVGGVNAFAHQNSAMKRSAAQFLYNAYILRSGVALLRGSVVLGVKRQSMHECDAAIDTGNLLLYDDHTLS